MADPASSAPPPITRFGRKDASHAAFYAGVAKGMLSALDGIQLFLSSPNLRSVFWDLLKPIRNAEIAYAAMGLLVFLFLRDPADDISELFWTISRWGRIITVITTFLLEKHFKANSAMFFAALNEKNPAFAAALQQRPVAKATMREKFTKFKRVAKMTIFKLAGAIINKVFPGGKYVAIPAVKFVSMRPVLGTGVAAAVSAIHAFPAEVLESSRVDDALVSFGESVLDADELGTDSTKEYLKRLDSDDMKAYFADRYRGYLTGCGFVYSFLSAIPFLGIPMTLIAECGAACVVTDIVQRNLEKESRKRLACEEVFQHEKTS